MSIDEAKYFADKTAQLNRTSGGGRSDWTVAQTKQAFSDAGLTPQQHYEQYGKAEGLSVSPNMIAPISGQASAPVVPVSQHGVFDENQYINNKVTQLNNAEINEDNYTKYGHQVGTPWTADDVRAAFAQSNLTPQQHYEQYGKAEGVDPWKDPPAPPIVQAPTYTPAPPIAAPTYEIDPNTMTVEGRLAGLLDPSNPLMQRAATQGMQYANSRGLLNSSIGAEAAQNAMIDQGIKIAGPDAETYFKQQGLNQDYTFRYDELGEKTREFDVGADQWQQGFNEDVRQFGLNFNEQTRQFDVGSQQWQKNFDEGVRQYGKDFMENVRKFDEGIREYDNNFDENSRQFDDNLQWLRDKSGEDLTFRYDDMDNDNKKAFIGTVGDARNKFDDYVAALMLNPDLSADDIQGLTDTAFTSLQSYIDLSAAYLGADISWSANDDVSIPQGMGDINYAEATQGLAAKGWISTDIARYLQGEGLTRQQALDALGNDPASVAAVNAVYGDDGLLESDVTPEPPPIADTSSAYQKALDKNIREMVAKYPAFDWDHLPSGEQILQYSRGKYDAGRGGSVIPIVGASGTW